MAAAVSAGAAGSALVAVGGAAASKDGDKPSVELKYTGLTYSVSLAQAVASQQIPNVFRTLLNTLLLPVRIVNGIARKVSAGRSGGQAGTGGARGKRELRVLADVSGVIRPGTLTLLLAPPGHGKSAYLKALAGLLPRKDLSGSISYSGVTHEGARAAGVHLGQLVQYVSQLDEHLPFLTPRETMSFVHQQAVLDPAAHPAAGSPPGRSAEHAAAVDGMIELLQLKGAQNTLVGNELVRGISGGERRRTTVGEGLVTAARVLALDEISTGLDSAVTYTIIASLKRRAKENGLSAVISLLQPPPETVALFDEIILLRDGAVAYHGPTRALPRYLQGLGFFPPALGVGGKGAMGGGAKCSNTAAPAAAGAAGAATEDRGSSSSDSEAEGEGAAGAASPSGVAAADSTAAGGAAAAGSAAAPLRPADLADWVVEMLNSPAAAHVKDVEALQGPDAAAAAREAIKRTAGVGTATAGADDAPVPPVTSAALAAAWKASSLHKAQMDAPPSAPPLKLASPYAAAQYGHSYVHSILAHTLLLVVRQFTVMRRNMLYVRSRIITATIMSVVLGGLYYQRSDAEGLIYYGVFLNSCMNIGFSNFAEMAPAAATKFIAYRHVGNGAYPAAAFPFSLFLAQLPVAIIECAIFTGIIFGMTGMQAGLSGAQQAAGWATYWLIIVLIDLCFAAMLRSFAFGFKTLQAAQSLPMPLISILILFAGFVVTPSKMGGLRWVNYIDVLGWAMTSQAQNEFLSGRYEQRPAGPGGPTLGELYLEGFGQPTDRAYLWGGVGFLVGFVVLTLLCSIRCFASKRFDSNIGSARAPDPNAAFLAPPAEAITVAPGPAAAAVAAAASAAPAAGSASKPDAAVVSTESALALAAVVPVAPTAPAPLASPSGAAASSGTFANSALPFTPASLAFKDIRYTVMLPKHMGGGTRVLLHGVTGFAVPGRMLALMGASGAGKTTLLDVIAGRKNSGTMEGAVLLNGFPKDAGFGRLTAYIEQQETLLARATVRESLEFSAALRLPASVTPAQRHAFVEEILELLELRDIAHRLVGKAGMADALAPAERKLLTIGVELCANAAVIFLDEPTSGLDSRAALSVMRVVKKLALHGRTIVCTVHQPSAELFGLFDDLLLLQRGGYTAYFGPLGEAGATVAAYLTARIPGGAVKPCPAGMNVASFMLDALAGVDSSAAHTHVISTTTTPKPSGQVLAEGSPLRGEALQATWLASPECAASTARLAAVETPKPGAAPITHASTHARSFSAQYAALLKRTGLEYVRNIGLNIGRLYGLAFLNVLFGVVWLRIAEQADDQGGVQSLVAAIFMSAAFASMISMNVMVPQLLEKRATFYREQASAMYSPIAYSLANFTVELPWLAGVVLAVTPIHYFFFSLKAEAVTFFGHWFATYVLSAVYISLGQTIAAVVPTFEVAQALLGIVSPLFFLFGGMWSPPSKMVAGVRWFCYIDPITYAFRALIPQQFYCEGGAAAGCPTITQVTPRGLVTVDRYTYVSSLYEVYQEDMWANVGYTALFIVAFQALNLWATSKIRHIVR